MSDPNPLPDTAELLSLFQSGPLQLRKAVAEMSDEQARARPVPGKWSTLEVMCHIADFEIVNLSRLQRIVAEDNPTLMSGDPDQFAAALQYHSRDLHEELTLIESVRQQSLRLYKSIDANGWSRPWMHSTDGPLTLRDLLSRTTNHIPHHLPFIEEKRQALGLEPSGNLVARNYIATIRWAQPAAGFLKGQYSREHTWTFDGGLTIPASPSPHVVPAPWSNPAHVDPEEAFVASVASCHMLTFLWVASKAGFIVERYEDAAEGVMAKNEQRIPWVSEITLRPRITWGGDRIPTAEELHSLHERAHEQCFIANSVRTNVRVVGDLT